MSPNSGNSLSAGSLASLMSSSLPRESKSQLKNPYDAIALFCHACMIAVGFRLIGLGEDHKIEPPPNSESESSATQSDTPPLPQEWNASDSTFSFRYAHSQSSMTFLLKVSRLGNKAVIFGIGLGDDKTTTFDVSVPDYLSPSAFPFPKDDDSASRSHDETATQLQALFISVGRIADLASLFKIKILQKLAPGIWKEGYEDSPAPQRDAPPDRAPQGPAHDPLRDDRFPPPPARPHPFADPLAADPRPQRPWPAGDFPPPGFEDEYEINRPPRGGFGGRHPLHIGERDLYPPGLGPHDPLRPGFGPAPGFGGAGGGMHPTFDDPLFGGDGGPGGGVYDPRAPPGARYDPVGPGDGPPNARGGPPRFPGGGGGGWGGRPPNPFGGFGGGDFI